MLGAAGAAAARRGAAFIVLLSFVTAALVDRVSAWLADRGAGVLRPGVGAAIPTVVATLVVVGQSRGVTFFGDVSPSLVVASGIVLLLAGLSVVGAAEDALEGYYVTAGARAFEVVVLSLGIAVGVSTVLAVGQRLGYPIAITSQSAADRQRRSSRWPARWSSRSRSRVSSYASGRAVVGRRSPRALGWVVSPRGSGSAAGTPLAVGGRGGRHRLPVAAGRPPAADLGARRDDGRASCRCSRAARPTRACSSSSHGAGGVGSPLG